MVVRAAHVSAGRVLAFGTLTNSAAISAAGGKGAGAGGNGGDIDLAGDYALINKADLTTRGGTEAAATAAAPTTSFSPAAS